MLEGAAQTLPFEQDAGLVGVVTPVDPGETGEGLGFQDGTSEVKSGLTMPPSALYWRSQRDIFVDVCIAVTLPGYVSSRGARGTRERRCSRQGGRQR